MMTTDYKKILIAKTVDFSKKIDSFSDRLYDLFGAPPDGQFLDYIYRLFDEYLQMVETAISDNGGWLAWFIFENDCGEKDLTATIGKKSFKVKTVSDLIKILESPES